MMKKGEGKEIISFTECLETEIFCFMPLTILREDEEDVAILFFIKVSVLKVLLSCKGNKLLGKQKFYINIKKGQGVSEFQKI